MGILTGPATGLVLAAHRPTAPATSSRLAAAALIVVATLVVACGQTVPTPPPSVGPTASPLPTPSPSPDARLPIDETAYRVGETFSLPVDEAGADWTAPSAAPVMPNGQPAMRVAFLPASCATGAFAIAADAAPPDAWETLLQDDNVQHGYTTGSWPAAQLPECASGEGRTYLEVAYRPFAPRASIHLAVSVTNTTDVPAAIEVIPVFTSADAAQPSLASGGFESLGPLPGPKKPRSAKARLLMAERFARTTLPDGSTPTFWGPRVTGCGPIGGKEMVITMQVGDAAPVEVGTCSDGGFLSDKLDLPLPPEGTKITLLMAGGTTKSQIRVSEFQWRGDRP